MTPRPIDHLVLAARDLESARAAYGRLGFTLAPVARHPFGTANSVVQFEGNYLEILTVADPAAVPEPTAERYSFAAFTRDFLAKREGLSMVALHSRDAGADRAEFAALGLPVYEPASFERMARGPDGVDRKLAFSLAFTSDARIREAGFFTCQHHFPENFWRREYQHHPNGAVRIDAAVMVARDPADFHEFLTFFTGQHDIRSTSLGVGFDLGTSRIDVMSRVAVRAFFGVDVAPDPRPRFVAARIAVRSLRDTADLLGRNSVAFAEAHGALVVPPSEASGAAIAFVSDARPGVA